VNRTCVAHSRARTQVLPKATSDATPVQSTRPLGPWMRCCTTDMPKPPSMICRMAWTKGLHQSLYCRRALTSCFCISLYVCRWLSTLREGGQSEERYGSDTW